MRDFVAHHYFDIDVAQVLWVLQNEIAPLKKAIQHFIKEMS